MLIALFFAMILLMLWPLLAEVRMVICSILAGCVGTKASQQLIREMPFADRLTLCGVKPHLTGLHREYGQYMMLQALLVGGTAAVLALVALLVQLRLPNPALIITLAYDAAAFFFISAVHAHAGYDPEKRTTRYNRNADK